MKRHSGLSGKLNNIMFFLAGVLTVVIIGILVIGIQTLAQNNSNKNEDYISSKKEPEQIKEAVNTTQAEESWESDSETESTVLGEEKWAEGVIQYKGHSYKYNANQKIYLLMGIDNNGVVRGIDEDVNDIVVLPKSATAIADNAFKGNERIEKVVLYEGIKSIGQYAFENCINLHTINFPESLMHIYSYAFRGCANLETLCFNEGLLSIEFYILIRKGRDLNVSKIKLFKEKRNKKKNSFYR